MGCPDNAEGPIEDLLQFVDAKEYHPIADDHYENADKGDQAAHGIVPVQYGIDVGIAESVLRKPNQLNR